MFAIEVWRAEEDGRSWVAPAISLAWRVGRPSSLVCIIVDPFFGAGYGMSRLLSRWCLLGRQNPLLAGTELRNWSLLRGAWFTSLERLPFCQCHYCWSFDRRGVLVVLVDTLEAGVAESSKSTGTGREI